MDVVQCLQDGVDEDLNLEYKDKRADSSSIVKELVAFCNANGGTLVLGVREDDGNIEEIQDVDFAEREEAINQCISNRVRPPIQFAWEKHIIDGNTVVSLSVDDTEHLHSFSENNQPIHPRRQGSTKHYMDSQEIRHYLEGAISTPEEEEQEYSPVEKTTEESATVVDQPEIFFTPIPDGYINRVCTFSPVFWPQNPYSATIPLGGPTNDELIDIFSSLNSTFEFDQNRSWFTIHQSTGAWFGRGVQNYLSALVNEEYRFDQVPEEYELEVYKNSVGVFVAEIGAPYPESNMIVHVEPWHESDHCRRMNIEIIFEGLPLDTRPLDEFLNEIDAGMTNAKQVSISNQRFPQVDQLPVKEVGLISSPWEDEFVSDAICANPFFENQEVLSDYLNLNQVGGMAEYLSIPGHLRDHHPVDESNEYDATGFTVTPFDEIGERIPVTLHNIDFQINW